MEIYKKYGNKLLEQNIEDVKEYRVIGTESNWRRKWFNSKE